MRGLPGFAKGLSALLLLAAVAPPSAPIHWTPLVLATDEYEAAPTFSLDGRELIYLSADRSFAKWHLLMSRCVDGRWTRPKPPPFAAERSVIEADPGYTPDGRGVYFSSGRQDPKNEDFDIWYVPRSATGRWGEARRLPEPVNSSESELLPRADLAGHLYFGSSRPGGFGKSDIYVGERGRDGRWRVHNVGPPVSTAADEYEAEISGDGRTMIVVSDRGDRSHLYRFVRAGATWREIGRVPADPKVFQVGPLLSPDARSLMFAQADPLRSGEIYRADLAPGGAANWPRACATSKKGRAP